MEFIWILFLPVTLLQLSWAKEPHCATIIVHGSTMIAQTDSDFICATMDWWPHDKCNYEQCPWGYSSVTNLDLTRPFLAKAISEFDRLRIRIGGSLQDQVLYDIGDLQYPCHAFQKMQDGLFGFSRGCLRMNRWDELNQFFCRTRAIVTFGLNALHGKHKGKMNHWEGPWDHSNAYDFIKYTISKGYEIDSWEFGNELSGNGVGASVNAEQYGRDTIKLKYIINELYNNSNYRSPVVAPGGFYDEKWYSKLLRVSGPHIINIVTHHIYNLGAGSDPNLISKILDPNHLDNMEETFRSLVQTIRNNGPWASPWVGESGGAYNSGGQHVSNTFVNSFWYVDQLGMASKHHTKVYCRQTLIGGNYGLLNTTTHVPNPDYYSALLWHRLMGKRVLSVDGNATQFLRHYAHCSKGKPGITLLLINLSNDTDFQISVRNDINIHLHTKVPGGNSARKSFRHSLKKTVLSVQKRISNVSLSRQEYHLTPKDGNLQSQTMLLNGLPLEVINGEIPTLASVPRNVNSPINVASLSIAFVVLPNFDAPACV